MERRFLSTPHREQLKSMIASWKLRSQNAPLIANNIAAVQSAILASDEAELANQRINNAVMMLADLQREIERAARRKVAVRSTDLKRFSDQLEEIYATIK